MPNSATVPSRRPQSRYYLLGLKQEDWLLLQRLARRHQTTKASVLRRSLREWAERSTTRRPA